jgi:Secretion system C-terminal sorting domain
MRISKYLLIITIAFSMKTLAQKSASISSVKENIDKGIPVDATPILEKNNIEVKKYFQENPGALTKNKLRKVSWNFEIGAKKNWYAYNFVTQSRYLTLFTCRAVGKHCYIFVEDSLWDERVNQEAVDSVLNAFDNRTPANPEMGIYDMDIAAFGEPPDVDGDPRIIILILNIKDGFSGSGGFSAGYFDSYNETSLLTSNKAEIYYVDANPLNLKTMDGLKTAMSTTAHEFQHMINFNYNSSNPQMTFINEGCSMLAELYCGYPIFDQSLYENETNYPLFGWRTNDKTEVLNDYSRAQRFFLYFWDHFGIDIFKYIVQGSNDGIDLLNSALQQDSQTLTFSDIFVDWLVANSLNDKSFNQYYGYDYPNLYKAHATTYYDPNISGGNNLYNLSADYITFSEGRNLKIKFSSSSSSILIKAIELGNNAKNVIDVPLNSELDIPDYGSTYSSVTFVVINSNQSSHVDYTFISSGTVLNTEKELRWDYTEPTGYLSLSKNDTVCVVFDGIKGATLDSIRVALRNKGAINGGVWEYLPNFTETPLNKKLTNSFTASVSTSPSAPYPQPWPNWATVDLSSYKISAAKSFAVAFSIEGPNTPGVMVTEYPGTNGYNSWTYSSEEGRWLYYVSDNNTSYIYLIRAYVSLAVTDTHEIIEESPKEFSLSQNYPNPFNPNTTIIFSLPKEEQVSIKVYNQLGQQVAELTNQVYGAGDHKIKFTGGNLSSGVYYYTIKAGSFIQTKKMMILK